MIIELAAGGLGHPEGPDVLADGRVVFVNTLTSDIRVYDPRSGECAVYGKCGGGPNALVVGRDGHVYVTQNGGTVGAWRAPTMVTPSIQRIRPDGSVSEVVVEASGKPLRAPNDLAFAPDGALWFTDSGLWDPDDKSESGRICRLDASGIAEIVEERGSTYPNGIAVDDLGRVLWVESYDRMVFRRSGPGQIEHVTTLPAGHVPDGFKLDGAGNLWIAAIGSGGLDVVSPTGELLRTVPVPYTPANCVFDGDALWATGFGDLDPSLSLAVAQHVGWLVRVEIGVTGQQRHRGAIAER